MKKQSFTSLLKHYIYAMSYVMLNVWAGMTFIKLDYACIDYQFFAYNAWFVHAEPGTLEQWAMCTVVAQLIKIQWK